MVDKYLDDTWMTAARARTGHGKHAAHDRAAAHEQVRERAARARDGHADGRDVVHKPHGRHVRVALVHGRVVLGHRVLVPLQPPACPTPNRTPYLCTISIQAPDTCASGLRALVCSLTSPLRCRPELPGSLYEADTQGASLCNAYLYAKALIRIWLGPASACLQPGMPAVLSARAAGQSGSSTRTVVLQRCSELPPTTLASA